MKNIQAIENNNGITELQSREDGNALLLRVLEAGRHAVVRVIGDYRSVAAHFPSRAEAVEYCVELYTQEWVQPGDYTVLPREQNPPGYPWDFNPETGLSF